MLKVLGIGLLGLFALMVLPSGVADQVNPIFYGTASMVLADSEGRVLLTQTVHNQITDEGEAFLISQVFDTTTAARTDFNRVGMICLIQNLDSVFGEGTVANLADNITSGAGDSCHQDTDVSEAGTSTAVIAVAAFTSGVDFTSGDEISGILICLKDGDDQDMDGCDAGSNDLAFAALDLTNATITGSDTITITYTFDVTTGSS